jgi:hypothetical protein
MSGRRIGFLWAAVSLAVGGCNCGAYHLLHSPDGGELTPDAGPECAATGTPLFNLGSVQAGAVMAPPLAVDSESLYFSINTQQPNQSTLMKMPLRGGTPVQLGTDPSGRTIFPFSLTSSLAVYAAGSEVMGIPRAGGSALTLTTGTGDIVGLVTDADVFYFSDDQGTHAQPLDGGASQLLTTHTGRLTLNGGTLFVVENVAGTLSQFQLWSVPTAGGQAAQQTQISNFVLAMTACGSGVCWIEGAAIQTNPPPALMRFEPGGAATTLENSLDFMEPLALVDDGADFFLTTGGGGAVSRVPASGGTPFVIAQGGGGMAVDDQCLFWSDLQGIHVVRKGCDAGDCAGPPPH